VIIIGILAAIAIPTFQAQRDKADQAACKSDTRNAAEAAVLYASDHGGSFAGLQIDTAADSLDLKYGFNQTDGIVTSVVGVPGADITLSSDCPDPVTNATWTTEEPDAGKVMGADIP
jgi:type II secretory pathway pseudopilin PulG